MGRENWDSVTVEVLRAELKNREMNTAPLDKILEEVKEYDKEHSGGPAPVMVEGQEQAEANSKRAREEDGEAGGAAAVEDAAKRLKSEVTVVLECPHGKAGLVIGKAGTTLRELQEKSGAALKVAPWNGVNDVRLIQIKGSASQVESVKQLITIKTGIDADTLPKVPDNPEAFMSTGAQHRQQQQMVMHAGPQINKTVHVPNEHVGLAIGKGGETLKLLKTMSGANVQVEKQCVPGTTLRPIVLTGTASEVHQAETLLVNKMASVGATVTQGVMHAGFGAAGALGGALGGYAMPPYGQPALGAAVAGANFDLTNYYAQQMMQQQQLGGQPMGYPYAH